MMIRMSSRWAGPPAAASAMACANGIPSSVRLRTTTRLVAVHARNIELDWLGSWVRLCIVLERVCKRHVVCWLGALCQAYNQLNNTYTHTRGPNSRRTVRGFVDDGYLISFNAHAHLWCIYIFKQKLILRLLWRANERKKNSMPADGMECVFVCAHLDDGY